MNDSFDFDNPDYETQEFLVGYKEGNMWKTARIPGKLTEKLVEKILWELNQTGDIIYSKKIMGVLEKEKHYTKKGEFLGL